MKVKPVFIIVLAASLASLMMTGASLAWLAAKTNTAENRFTLAGPDGLTGEIVERFNPDDAKNTRPGQDVTKVVQVKNTSPGGMREWVAVKVTFLKGDGSTAAPADMDTLNRVMSLSFGSEDQVYNDAVWVRKNTGPLQSAEVFYCSRQLAAGSTSDPLFDAVKILGSADNALLQTVNNDWGGFDIRVAGAALQGSFSDSFNSAVQTELDGTIDRI